MDRAIFRTYFTYVFPAMDLCKWLSYKEDACLQRREFSIKLVKGVYLRYLTFEFPNHFRAIILKEKPAAINIGAIYNVPPKKNDMSKTFVERELVFDIDISDYNDVRTCCQNKDICKRCWKYIVIACKILNKLLVDSLGYNKILWIFSGRRGIHCWVCDREARKLDEYDRSAIITFLKNQLLKCFLKNGQFRLRKLNYYDRCMLSFIEPEFVPLCIVDQNVLGTEEGMNYFLALLPDPARKDVKKIFKEKTTSLDRWNGFIEYHKFAIDSQLEYWKRLAEYLDHIKLHYCGPRFDVNVTKDCKHLLRCPFSIHYETGKIALPFDITQVEEFDPTTSFTMNQIVAEVNIIRQKQSTMENLRFIIDYNKTSLRYPMIIFRKFIEEVVSEEK
ncbi:DNA primase small subunit-like isoform X2 [Polistes fuscatus]|uniref:DNA primase small subunit-like isoform X2 n=1 Tax=Polistes fuscatus TaxID=30207 RepID=UPI001CA9AC97|nr:DNA primase small subunit-like isoform X2 [Polistes fuscatus]XP_043488828.1 DNA primase small subunit-like isoform X2 [Polistes fuscatus]